MRGGVRNDARMWQENQLRLRRIYPWEYGLGDKAYPTRCVK
jgi:hypothetical protein